MAIENIDNYTLLQICDSMVKGLQGEIDHEGDGQMQWVSSCGPEVFHKMPRELFLIVCNGGVCCVRDKCDGDIHLTGFDLEWYWIT